MFKFSSEQVASIRRKKIGDGLIATFEDSPIRAGWNDDNNCVVATDPLEHSTRFGFDTQGFIGSVASPTGRLWQIESTADGKPVLLNNPAGHTLGLTYTSAGDLDSIFSNGNPRVKILYNDRQMQAGMGFPDGTYAAAEYTDWNSPARTTDRLGVREAFEYDEHHRLTAFIDGKGARTQFRYGQWSRPDATIDPNGAVESYQYNDKGLVSQIATETSSVELECNDKGRPLQMQFSDGTEAKYQYNDKGLATESAIGDYLCKAVWNEEGRLAEEQNGDAVIKYEYDKIGRLAGMTYPSGEKIEYQWDADSRLIEVRDWNGGKHTIRYEDQDRGSTLYGANGLETRTRLNDLGSAEAIDVLQYSRMALSLRYQYDKEDRVSALSDSVFGNREFAYDAESQLLAVNSEDNTKRESFQYDVAGNPVVFSGKPARFDAANQMLSHANSRMAYDDRGNLVAMEAPDGIWRFSYNARNYMVRSESPKGKVTTYDYDAYGRRIRKTGKETVVEFTWAGEQLIGEVAKTGEAVVRRDYLYFPGTFTPLAMRVGGKIYSYHNDHLGTPRLLTNPEGAVAWAADYSGFGQARIASATVENPLRFAGQYFDSETGLHYNRFRYYSPAMGRYTTRDPLGFAADNNFYRYVANDPVNQTDSFGLFGWAALGVLAASVAVAAAVIVLAPVALPVAILLAGAAAVAVGAGLNQALNESEFCLPCILKASGHAISQYSVGVFDSTIKPLAQTVLHPINTVQGLAHAIFHPITTAKGIADVVVQTGKSVLRGDPKAIGEVAGIAATIALATETTSEGPDYARQLYNKAADAEKTVTPALQSIADDNGAEMAGLDYRLKSIESLTRKIQTDSELQGIPINDAASNVGDSLRYTMVLPKESFGAGVQDTLDSLDEAGFTKLKVSNTFQPDASYMGVNTNFAAPDGQVFELQFHTPESLEVKQTLNHSLYEEARLPTTPPERVIDLQNQMKANSSQIPMPNGVDSIGNFRIGE